MNTKNVILAMAIAMVFLIAAVGSASANGVCVGANYNFSCGMEVNESCTLNATMTCDSGRGLRVVANDITIEGNNHVMDGVTPGDSCTVTGQARTGIYNRYYDNLVIKNLTIKNFCNGIYLRGNEDDHVDNNTIKNCTIYDNGRNVSEVKSHGIKLNFVYNSTINNCTIYNNTGGADCTPDCENGGSGIFMYAGEDNNITNNKIYDNKKGGFFTKAKPLRTNISYNEIWGNHQGGIILRCKCCANNTIEYNTVAHNYGTGIFIGGPCNTIRHNDVINNKNGSIEELPDTGHNGCGVNFGRNDSDIDCGYAPCGSIGSRYNNLSSNRICGNEYLDIWERAGVRNTNEGDNNICDEPDGWNDDGTTGCTYPCVYPYKYQVDNSPGANDPNIEFNTTEYANARVNDDVRACNKTTTEGYYAAHRFNFTVKEPASKISKINVTWNGIGDHDSAGATKGAKLYIYNFNSAGYEELDSSTTGPTEITLTEEKTSSISSYINSNNVTILVNQTSAQTVVDEETKYSHIKTDLAKIVIYFEYP